LECCPVKKYIYCYLKRIVHDKLLKHRQSFWITLYFYPNMFFSYIFIYHVTWICFPSFVRFKYVFQLELFRPENSPLNPTQMCPSF
jgi:hypothetical protein